MSVSSALNRLFLWCVFWYLIDGFVCVRAAIPLCVGVVLPFTSSNAVMSHRQMVSLRRASAMLRALPDSEAVDMQFLVRDTFSYAKIAMEAAMDLIQNGRCNNSESVKALFGSIDDEAATQVSSVAAVFNVPVMTASSRDPALSSPLLYPSAYRLIPSFDQEAQCIVDLFTHFQWHQAALIFYDSTRAYGNVLETVPNLKLMAIPLSALNLYANVVDALVRIRDLRYRVIVVDVPPVYAQLIMQMAVRDGMFNGDFIWIGSSRWTPKVTSFPPIDHIPWKGNIDAIQFNEEERANMNGLLLLDENFLGIDKIEQFLMDNVHFDSTYYPPTIRDIPSVPELYAYQSGEVLGRAYRAFTTNQTKYKTYVNALHSVDYVDIYGVHINFEAGSGNAISWFNITNLQGQNFVPIGRWDSSTGLTFSTPVRWIDGTLGGQPGDQVPLHLMLVADGAFSTSIIILVLCWMLTFTLHRLLYVQRQHEVIKASSPVFCHIICAGSSVIYCGTFLGLLQGNNQEGFLLGCRFIPTLLSIGFTIMFSSLMTKSWRIHKIFNSTHLTANKSLDSLLLIKIVCAAVALDVIILGCWMLADLPQVAFDTSNQYVGKEFFSCSNKNETVWWTLVCGTKVLILLYGVFLAYQIRDINHSFSESKYITLSLYNVMIMSLILVPMIVLFSSQPSITFAAKTIGVNVATAITLLILFGPKFWDIYVTKSWVDYQSESSYVSGVLVHHSSRKSLTGVIKQKDGSLNSIATTTNNNNTQTTRMAPTTKGAGASHKSKMSAIHAHRDSPSAEQHNFKGIVNSSSLSSLNSGSSGASYRVAIHNNDISGATSSNSSGTNNSSNSSGILHLGAVSSNNAASSIFANLAHRPHTLTMTNSKTGSSPTNAVCNTIQPSRKDDPKNSNNNSARNGSIDVQQASSLVHLSKTPSITPPHSHVGSFTVMPDSPSIPSALLGSLHGKERMTTNNRMPSPIMSLDRTQFSRFSLHSVTPTAAATASSSPATYTHTSSSVPSTSGSAASSSSYSTEALTSSSSTSTARSIV